MADESYTATPEQRNQAAWDSLMGLYLSAKAEADDYDVNVFSPSFKERMAMWPDILPRCERERTAMERWLEQNGTNEISDKFQKMIDLVCAREDALMGFPAPTFGALRWKLDKLFEPDDGGDCTASWAMFHVRQTIEDYQHLLGGKEA